MSLPVGIERSRDPGGRDTVVLSNAENRVEVARWGAQVLSWKHGGAEVLWAASKAVHQPGKQVRGGVPLVFPWFGDHAGDSSLPAHGFARDLEWSIEALEPGPTAVFSLRDDEGTRAIWPHSFRAELTVSLRQGLDLALRIQNPGPNEFSYEAALHSYFDVGDVTDASVHGLEGLAFVEQASAGDPAPDRAGPVRFRAETDRIYQDVAARIELRAPGAGRIVTLAADGARSAIVWNPWVEKAARLSQMGEDDWRRFCCVETANVRGNAVALAPGTHHVMALQLRCSATP